MRGNHCFRRTAAAASRRSGFAALASQPAAAGKILLAVLVLCLWSPAARAAGAQTFCDWVFNGQVTAPADGQPRPDYVDLYAGYWELYLGSNFPAGTVFQISGQYPQARYFSFQALGSLSQLLPTVGGLADYQIVADAGSQSPYPAINVVDPSIPPGGSYSVDLVFSAPPAVPAQNTLYVDPSKLAANSIVTLTYRIYSAFSGITVADHGGVPLPAVSEVTARGDVPASSLVTPLRCDIGVSLADASLSGPARWFNSLYAEPLAPGPVAASAGQPAPVFSLYAPDNTLYALNIDVNYLSSGDLSQTKGDLVLMRMLAPTYATSAAGGTDPQLRFWSICESGSLQTFSCLEDQDAVLDSGGYVNLVMSVPAKQPARADAAHGFNWISFGTTEPGVLIYRQLLAAPDYTRSFVGMPDAASASAVMGDYFPVATYCSNAVFAGLTAAGDTPAQVFAGCQAAR